MIPASDTRQRWLAVIRLSLRDWGGLTTLVFAGYLATYCLWLIVGWGGPERRDLINDVAILPLGLAAAVLPWRLSVMRALDTRSRRAWRLISVAYAVYLLADLIWSYYELVLHSSAFPSPADVPFITFYPLLFVALLMFPTAPRSSAGKTKFGLDAAMILLGSGMVLWHFVLRPITLQYDNDLTMVALSLAYPVGSIALLAGLIFIHLRESDQRSRGALRLLMAGLLLQVANDTIFAYLSLTDAYYSGHWSDSLYMASRFAVVAAAQYQFARASLLGPAARVVRPMPAGRPFSVLPYASLASGYALLLIVAHDQLTRPLGNLILAAVAMTALVVARQFTALRENARLLAEAATRQSEARFAALIQNSSDVIAIMDLDTTIRYESPAGLRVFGHAPADVIGVRLTDGFPADDLHHLQAFLSRLTRRPRATAQGEWRMRHPDGSWRYYVTIGANLLDEPNVRGLVLNTRDVTERRALEDQIRHQAFHDPLTGLANRALVKEHIEHALTRAQRSGDRPAILFLDLDDFKTVNDSLGHAVGDALLTGVASRLRDCVRAGDTVARLGGDEFVILLDDTGRGDEAVPVARKALDALRHPFAINDKQIHVGVSIGIAAGDPGVDDADTLLRNADVAMYDAKSRGKSRYAVYHPGMYAAVVERMELEADLRRAVERGEFVLHYQPIVDLSGGRMTGVEALVRWQHPVRGLIPPLSFISAAEETGLIVPLGRWVLFEACREIQRWRDLYPEMAPLSMSVNLSGRQLQHAEIVDDVAAALAETGLNPHALVLEITESVMMQDTEAAITKLHAIKALGVRLAIDDFGTGYSSLSYLQRFPVDILKVDKSFLDNLGVGAERSDLAQAIIALGHTLNLQTVAEGIEHADQLDRLRVLRCDSGQGYLFSRPVDGAAIEALLLGVSDSLTDPREYLPRAG